MARVLIYVQHLLGVGHAQRAALIGRALAEEGAEVALVSGGMPVPGLDITGFSLHQLPPARAGDESFSQLVDEQGCAVDDTWRERRRERLLRIFKALKPDVLITEQFPFGRRQLQFELLPLLELAHQSRPRPWVVCSVRDILVESPKPGRYEEMAALANAHFDRVLVHGDEGLIPFQRSFPLAHRLAPKLIHTGYVVNAAPARSGMGGELPADEVLVSGGSRALGAPLIQAALAARPISLLADHPWRLFAGINLPVGRLKELQACAAAGVTLEPFRPDYRELLGRAALSISQGGYNTTMEVIAAGVPAVLAPHATENDSEQGLRARLLSERGLVTLAETLDGAGLARAIDAAVSRGRSRSGELNMNGAAATARLIANLVEQSPAPAARRT